MADWIETDEDLVRQVRAAVDAAPVTDMHTHLYAAPFGDLLLRGIDELLTYHYLVAEVMRVSPLSYEAFWSLDKQGRANHIWTLLFRSRSPLSEAARGILTALGGLGLDPNAGLDKTRQFFSSLSVAEAVRIVFQAAGVQEVVMTNDPLDDAERAVWLSDRAKDIHADRRFRAALRIDPLLLDWAGASVKLRRIGYAVPERMVRGDETGLAEVRRFLREWVERMRAVYMAVSLPPDFDYPGEEAQTTLLEDGVLPVCRELGISFAVMVGVRRQVNPALQLAGDGSGTADLEWLGRLCAGHPHNRFFATVLARENQHELVVLGRKFRNLMVFGCWWFMNNPSLVLETTRMRLEMLGTSFIPQHSDARILEQLVYKWRHARRVITTALIEQYRGVMATGWRLTGEEIANDVKRLFQENFRDFIGSASR